MVAHSTARARLLLPQLGLGKLGTPQETRATPGALPQGRGSIEGHVGPKLERGPPPMLQGPSSIAILSTVTVNTVPG